MTTLNQHGEYRQQLISWYQRIIDEHAELLLDEANPAYSQKSLRDALVNLSEDRFIVAVCGQMNAGKSTLLNALLFEREVLPAAATTMTAKVALIEGGEEERVTATLYTQREFDEVVRAAASDEVARRELSEARDNAKKHGILEREVLQNPAHAEHRQGLSVLKEFCAVPHKGGTYTPYVRDVQLQGQAEWLKQVTVADTPGTNDPNPERDKITKEWISRADAVVYVTYAGQAGMSGEDVKFIDTYLRHISPLKRIIAVNKRDVIPDQDGIRRHFRSLANSDDLRMQELFKDDGNIVLVSGISALIERMRSAGDVLSDKLEEEAAILEVEGWLEPERHGLSALREKIEQRIISTRGEDMIKSHAQRIEAVFETAKQALEAQRLTAFEALSVCGATRDEREEEMRRIKEAILEVELKVEMARKRVTAQVDEVFRKSGDTFGKLGHKISEEVNDHMSSIKQIDNIASQAAWVIPRTLTNQRDKLSEPIKEMIEVSEKVLNKAEQELSQELLSGGLGEYKPREHLLIVSVTQLLRQLEAHVKLDQKTLAKMVVDASRFYQRWFNTNRGKKNAVESIDTTLYEAIMESIDMYVDHATQKVKTAQKEALQQMEKSVQSILQTRQNQLKDLQEGEGMLATEAGLLSEKVQRLEARINTISELHQRFRSEVLF